MAIMGEGMAPAVGTPKPKRTRKARERSLTPVKQITGAALDAGVVSQFEVGG